MNTLDKKYTDLLQDILDNGIKKQTRNGEVLSVFGRQIRHFMSEGFPLLTTKKMYFKGIVTELIWFLRGSTDIRFLWENNCTIWDGDWEKHYKTRCSSPYTIEEVKQKIKEKNHHFHDSMFDMGPIYGKQWRRWKTKEYPTNEPADYSYIDQIANLINELKTNPDSRRLMVNAWNVGELDQMVLPPCHYGFQVYTRELSLEERHKLALPIWKEKYGPLADMMVPTNVDNTPYKIPRRAISLMFNMRSTDVGLGLSFNLASYGLLLMMIAKQVNMIPEELIYNGGDVHLYANHIEPIKEQLTREPYPLPTVRISDRPVNDISEYTLEDTVLENYQSHPSIKMPLSN